MSSNPYYPPLAELFARIVTLRGMLFQLEDHLRNYEEQVVEWFTEQEANRERFLQGHFLVIADITDESQGEWRNVFPTGFHHVVSEQNYREQVQKLITREAGFTVSQATEYFDGFKKDLLATYFHLHPDKYPKANKVPVTNTLEAWQVVVRDNRELNKKHLDTFSSIAPHFKASIEGKYKYLQEWHSVLLEVRHAITHAESYLKASRLKDWNEHKTKVLTRDFPVISRAAGYDIIFGMKEAERTMNKIAEFAFLLFKSLSMVEGHDWKVLMHMK